MLVGNPNTFAIESCMSIAHERLSSRALGFFLIHVGGLHYGVREPDASMLACSLDEVERRLQWRGRHVAPFAEAGAFEIADAYYGAVYRESAPGHRFLGMSAAEMSDCVYDKRLVWAPDGDETFDDGSYVLQFDVADRVRLIAFKSLTDFTIDLATLGDVSLPATGFYQTLEQWRDAFLAEWNATPKSSE